MADSIQLAQYAPATADQHSLCRVQNIKRQGSGALWASVWTELELDEVLKALEATARDVPA